MQSSSSSHTSSSGAIMDRPDENAAHRGNTDGSCGNRPAHDKGKLVRNKRPCGRCSKSQRKCDIEPPYSPSLCKQCAKAGLTECPPYEPRKKVKAGDSATRASPTDSLSSYEGGAYDGRLYQHSRQSSGGDADAIFLMHPSQMRPPIVAAVPAYPPSYPVPPPSAGYIQPSTSMYNWENPAGWQQGGPPRPIPAVNNNMIMNAQGQAVPFDGTWGEPAVGVYCDPTAYQTTSSPNGMPFP